MKRLLLSIALLLVVAATTAQVTTSALRGDITVNDKPLEYAVVTAIHNPSQAIYGTQAEIDSIQYITTDSIYYNDLRDSIQITAQLVAPQHIRVHPKQVTAKWKAEPFTEKTFTLPIYTVGTPNNQYIRLFPQQVDVVIRVGISHFAQVASNDLQAICRYPKQASKSLPVEIITDNPYISDIRFTPTEVEYIIERK